jgi:pimeloyl-ACP methyl ester carboxylesterase
VSFPEVHRPATESTERPLVLLHGGNVANWMWEPQVAAFADRVVCTPDLPGFGTRVGEDWPGLDAVADDLVARVAGHGIDGPFDLVGLSLGGLTALRVLARHPDRVRSAFVTSAPLGRAGAGMRLYVRLQLRFLRSRPYWRAQAALFGLPEDSRERYVTHGMSIRREAAAAMAAEVCAGGVPADLAGYSGPLLASAGEKDSAAVRRSLAMIAGVVPQAQVRIVPGLHHIWNVEDFSLFNEVLRAWLAGSIDPRLHESVTGR